MSPGQKPSLPCAEVPHVALSQVVWGERSAVAALSWTADGTYRQLADAVAANDPDIADL